MGPGRSGGSAFVRDFRAFAQQILAERLPRATRLARCCGYSWWPGSLGPCPRGASPLVGKIRQTVKRMNVATASLKNIKQRMGVTEGVLQMGGLGDGPSEEALRG